MVKVKSRLSWKLCLRSEKLSEAVECLVADDGGYAMFQEGAQQHYIANNMYILAESTELI